MKQPKQPERPAPATVELSLAAVEEMLGRIEGLLARPDYELIALVISNLLTLLREVRERGATIARLRRLFRLSKSDKTATVLQQAGMVGPDAAPKPQAVPESKCDSRSAANDAAQPAGPDGAAPEGQAAPDTNKRKGHGRIPTAAYTQAPHIAVPHQTLHAGDCCPKCAQGGLCVLREPALFLRIFGQAPLGAKCWDCERLRCCTCGWVFTARAPEEAQGEKHDESAAAMIAVQRYSAGMPLNRLAQLQSDLATPVAASTQWDILNSNVESVRPVHDVLLRQAAQGTTLHNDDTYMGILEFMGKRRAALVAKGLLPDPERTGLFTSAIVAIGQQGYRIALFFTGRRHAGENLAEVLQQRAAALAPPILMSDALARNLPVDHPVREANCLAHGRTHIVDEIANFPQECRHVLEQLAIVYRTDALCKEQGLSDDERLTTHQQVSASVMEELKKWMTTQLDDKRIEPNSGMGKAINYFLKRWDKFTLFLRESGVPIDNNICERALKMAIRNRNNSLFYRSQRGAQVGDIYMSLIHTAQLHGANPHQYLTALMRHAKAVSEKPDQWLPWNYREALARLEQSHARNHQRARVLEPPTLPRLKVA